MEIPKSRLGLGGDGTVNVVNLKISPEMLPSLLQERGVFPAYHMSKTHWVTVALDGAEVCASDEMAEFLTEVSFTLTAKKTKKKK
jgi:predicted DNA-binding protein (MmcQ/YjbR family)